MDVIDSDDSDLEMAFMEEVVIPSFGRQRKLPVPRQVNIYSYQPPFKCDIINECPL